MGNNKRARVKTESFTFITFSLAGALRMWALPTSYTYDVAHVNMVESDFFWDRVGPLGQTPKGHVADVNTLDIMLRKRDAPRQTLSPRKLKRSIAGGRDPVDCGSRADRLYPA